MFKMRALDDDDGTTWITWLSSTEDYAGVGFPGGTPTPVGSMVAGSAVVAGVVSDAGGMDESIFMSVVDGLYERTGGYGTPTAGDFTTGVRYVFHRAIVVTGIRFAWGGGVGAKTIRASLWQYAGSGTRLAQVDVAVNAAGIYEATFAAPYTIAAAYVGPSVVATIWDTAGAGGHYNKFSTPLGDGEVTAGHMTVAKSITMNERPGRYGAGDVSPGSLASSPECYGVEPIIQL